MSNRPKGLAVAGMAFGIAIGTAFGTYILGPNSGASSSFGHNAAAQSEVDQLTAQRDQARKGLEAADQFGGKLAPDAVHDALAEKKIVVFTVAGSDPQTVDAVKELVGAAGGTINGVITLKESFLDSNNGDELKSLATSTLPAGVQLSREKLDPGTHVGELMGSALSVPKEGEKEIPEGERSVVLNAFTQGEFITVEGKLDPVDGAIFVIGDQVGDTKSGYGNQLIADMATAFDSRSHGTVVAGPPAASKDSGAIARIRENREAAGEVTTVDDVNHVTGRVSVVRGLAEQFAGRSGSFGVGEGAGALVAQ